jgi:anti-sigma B factor antagonist
VDLKLSHYYVDGVAVIDIEGEVDVYTAPRLRELLLDLVRKRYYQLVVNMDKVEFLDSTGLGVLVGGLKRVRDHDGSIDLVCTQQRILKIFRITGLMNVFGFYRSVDEAIGAAARTRRPTRNTRQIPPPAPDVAAADETELNIYLADGRVVEPARESEGGG